MKQQVTNLQYQTKEEEVGKLPEKEFRVIVKMVQSLQNRTEKIQESINTFNKDLEEIKNKQKETTQLMQLKTL